MSAGEKLLGAGALVMALCCAVLPLARRRDRRWAIAGAGAVGLIAGALVLVAVVVAVTRRRRC